MYLFRLHCNLRVEAGLKGIFALHFTLFTLCVILTNDRSVVTDGRLEFVVGKRRVAIFEWVLEFSQINHINASMVLKQSK